MKIIKADCFRYNNKNRIARGVAPMVDMVQFHVEPEYPLLVEGRRRQPFVPNRIYRVPVGVLEELLKQHPEWEFAKPQNL